VHTITKLSVVFITCVVARISAAEVAVIHETVSLEGVGKLAAVITVPATPGRKPALFLAGWLSCDSVASTNASDGFVRFMKEIASRSGFVFMRVDKPGVGGSDGNCAETDFKTELEGYRAGWRQLAARPDVDPSRIFILGLSNGGGFAPLVPSEPGAAGYISIGGWSKTWFEHMIAFERTRLTLKGIPAAEVNTLLKSAEQLYDEYLNHHRSPAEIVREHPELKAAWDGPTIDQYGRPPAFFQQLQELNLVEAWSHVSVPTLVIHAGQDWIMNRSDKDLIVECVNHGGRHLATFKELPRMDHFFLDHDSMLASFQEKGRPQFDAESANVVINWLRRTAGLDNQ
jgi:dienelactone hydrolase